MPNYTVTASGTYFVEANNADEALNLVYEAMLGNDEKKILGWGEIDWLSMSVKRGTHYTIAQEEYDGK